MFQRISHSQDDGSLPSFHHPKLREVLSNLELVEDCWNLLDGVKEKYLPQEPGEPSQAYKPRVLRSSYPDFYRRAIQAFAGVLSQYTLKGAPRSMMESLSDIDGMGNSLLKWGIGADELVLRDNGCLVMVDMPPGKSTDLASEKREGRVPTFSIAERRNVLSWRMKKIGRKMVPDQVVIREWREVESGTYGTEYEPVYRLMKGGEWQLIRIRGIQEMLQQNKGRSMAAGQLSLANVSQNRIEEIPEEEGGRGTFEKAGGGLFDRPPVVWYGAGDNAFGEGRPTLLGLANLTLDWYRGYSDYMELLHKCSLPVGELIGDLGTDPITQLPRQAVVGPNSILHFPKAIPGQGFNWKEPSGGSLAQRLDNLKYIKELIDAATMEFAFGGKQRTATEAQLEATQVQASVRKMAESKASAYQELMQLWGEFTGDAPDNDANLIPKEGILSPQVTLEDIGMAQKLYDGGLIMRDSVVTLIERRGMLPEGRDAKEEDQLLAEEEARRAEEEAARMNPPIPPDVANGTADNLDQNGLPIQ